MAEWRHDLWYAAPGREREELVEQARDEGYSDEEIAMVASVPSEWVTSCRPNATDDPSSRSRPW